MEEKLIEYLKLDKVKVEDYDKISKLLIENEIKEERELNLIFTLFSKDIELLNYISFDTFYIFLNLTNNYNLKNISIQILLLMSKESSGKEIYSVVRSLVLYNKYVYVY